ncbi:hypothetical protein [Suttonella ornithocola]|uniref:Uncharacterized protein n=1 Tax=Suttonella ornithocola TaxID=279832 RepID=A0A380MRL0_9GAMM|nr:hypothetical protein [Suttonella ornithocola]SUO95240.1 Uncharacterised protein [Suttonella ornithocola]
MPKIEYKWEINITTAIAVFAFVAAGFGSYYAGLQDRALIRQQMDTMQAEYRSMLAREENERKAADTRIEMQANNAAAQLKADMRDMGAKIDRIYETVVKGR